MWLKRNIIVTVIYFDDFSWGRLIYSTVATSVFVWCRFLQTADSAADCRLYLARLCQNSASLPLHITQLSLRWAFDLLLACSKRSALCKCHTMSPFPVSYSGARGRARAKRLLTELGVIFSQKRRLRHILLCGVPFGAFESERTYCKMHRNSDSQTNIIFH